MISPIRLAREADAAILAGVERSAAQSFRTMAGLEWIVAGEVLDETVHSCRIRSGTCWVAPDEHDTPIGFLSAEVIAEHDLHIYEMSVAASFQGHGAGRALLTAAIEWAVRRALFG